MKRMLNEIIVYVKTMKEVCEKSFEKYNIRCDECPLKQLEEILGMV